MDIFTPPLPSNWGIVGGSSFTYVNNFPVLNPTLFGPQRKARTTLQKKEDIQRNRKVLSDEVLAKFNTRKSGDLTNRSQSGQKSDIQEILMDSKKHFNRICRSLISFQSIVRMRKIRLPYKKRRAAAKVISHAWKAYRHRQLRKKYNAQAQAKICLIQSVVRRYIARKKFVKRYKQLILLQSVCRMGIQIFRYRASIAVTLVLQKLYRGYCQRIKYRKLILRICKMQAMIKGWLRRKKELENRKKKAIDLRNHIQLLWHLEHTPLILRSKFWKLIQGESILIIAIYEEECKRLWNALGWGPKLQGYSSFANKFIVAVNTLQSILQRPPPVSQAQQHALNMLNLERKAIYDKLKLQITPEQREIFFRSFGITGKKRKKNLSERLWLNRAEANASADVLLFGVSAEECKSFVADKRRDKIRAAAVESVRACFKTIQKFNTTKKMSSTQAHTITTTASKQRHRGIVSVATDVSEA